MFKRTLQIFFGVALVMQLAGCFFEDRDHRGYYEHREHHEDHEDHGHDAGVDVHVHG